jgi:hypothetical protein
LNSTRISVCPAPLGIPSHLSTRSIIIPRAPIGELYLGIVIMDLINIIDIGVKERHGYTSLQDASLEGHSKVVSKFSSSKDIILVES